jgi:uncharacterized protein (TIGR00725 family)
MPRRPTIAVIGSGREIEPAVSNARELGRLIAEQGWVLITGGRDSGVMRAANEGAKSAKDSLTIGILPNRETKVSPAVDIAIITDTGEARNNIIVLSADVVIACGVEGAGTASEVALALKNGKQVVFLNASEEAINLFGRIGENQMHIAQSAEEVIRIATSLTGS